MTVLVALVTAGLTLVAPAPQVDAPRPDPAVRAHRYALASYGVAGRWDRLAGCESGGDWHEGDGGLGPFRGGLQWHPDTWAKVRPPGAPADPADATREQEIAAGEALLAQPWGSWAHWPSCARRLGLLRPPPP